MQQIWPNLMIVTIMSHGKKFKKRESSWRLDSALWANRQGWIVNRVITFWGNKGYLSMFCFLSVFFQQLLELAEWSRTNLMLIQPLFFFFFLLVFTPFWQLSALVLGRTNTKLHHLPCLHLQSVSSAYLTHPQMSTHCIWPCEAFRAWLGLIVKICRTASLFSFTSLL